MTIDIKDQLAESKLSNTPMGKHILKAEERGRFFPYKLNKDHIALFNPCGYCDALIVRYSNDRLVDKELSHLETTLEYFISQNNIQSATKNLIALHNRAFVYDTWHGENTLCGASDELPTLNKQQPHLQRH